MFESVLTTILTKIVTTTATTVIRREGEKLLFAPPFERAASKAIDKTEAAFPEVEVAFPLRNWLVSEGFRMVVTQLVAGNYPPDDSAVFRSFVDEGGFFLAERTDEVAPEVLRKFLEALCDELYETPQGIAIAAKRQEFLIERQGAAIREHNAASFARIEAALARLVPDSSRTAQDDTEAPLHARIDEARDLLREGKPKTARSILNRLRGGLVEQSVSQRSKFRITTNLGSCALQLGELSLAAQEFRHALEIEPENPKALANAALGACMAGDTDEALRLVIHSRQFDPKDAHAASVHLEVLHRLGRFTEIEQLIRDEAWIATDPICCQALGEIYYQRGAYHESEAYFRRGVTVGDETNPEALHLLALAIVAQVEEPNTRKPVPPVWQAAGACDAVARLAEADALLTQAITILEEREARNRLLAALENRAAVRAMQSRFGEALSDCDRALTINPNSPVALHNRPLFLLALNRSRDAIEAFRRIPPARLSASLAASFAVAYLRDSQPLAAIQLLEAYWIFEPGEDDRLAAAEVLLWAYHEARELDRCAEIVGALAEISPSNPKALSAIAAHHERQGSIPQAIGVMREALAYATDGPRELVTLQLADLLAREGEYGEAASLYSQVIDVTSRNLFTIPYLKCLFNAGELGRALDISRRIRGDGSPLPVISEVEAKVLESMDELDAARDLRVKLSTVEPGNVAHRLAVAVIDYRRGRLSDAQAVIDSIALHELRGDAVRLMQVAQMRAQLRMPDAMGFAYEARRTGFQSAEIHLAYVGLVLRREKAQDHTLNKTVVEVDCTVDLKDEQGGSRVFTITDDPDLSKNEIAPCDDLARKLMGHQVGDHVVVKDTPLETLTYEITNVRSKYVSAFQESILNFSTWFSAHEGFHRITVQDNELSKVLFSVDERNALVNQVRNLYLGGGLTLGTMAHLLGTTQFAVWSGLAAEADGRILTNSGNPSEMKDAVNAIARTQWIVIDATALFTIKHLGIQEQIAGRFPNAIVAQAVVDEMRESADRESSMKGAGSMGKAGDRYVMQEFSDAFVEARVRFLEEVGSFIASDMRIVGVTAAIDLGTARFQEMERILGKGAIASIYAARDNGAVLVSDDLKLREVARNDWNVSSAGSQALLVLLRKEGLLSGEEYHRHTAALALANYYFLSFDAPTLVWAIESEPSRLCPAVPALLKALQGPNCTEESAVHVITETIRAVWLTPGMLDRKLLVLDLSLNALAKGRSVDAVLARFKRALRTRFALAPLPLPTILRSIELWRERFLLPRGLAGS